MRFVDVMFTIPLLLVAAVLGRAVRFAEHLRARALIIASGVVADDLARSSEPSSCRFARRSTSKRHGRSAPPNKRIIWRHIMPNAIGSIDRDGDAADLRGDPGRDRAVVPRPRRRWQRLVARQTGVDLSTGVQHPTVAVLVARHVHRRRSRCASTSSATVCAMRSTRSRHGCASDRRRIRPGIEPVAVRHGHDDPSPDGDGDEVLLRSRT